MAIIKELFKTREDGEKLYRTYSDENKIIKQVETGNEYSEAIDIEDASYTYVETDEYIDIDTTQLEELETKAKAYDILVGEVE